MIQIITVTATAFCEHCGGPIERGKGDLEREERWWHRLHGRPECPQTPTAAPRRGTVHELVLWDVCPWHPRSPEAVSRRAKGVD